MTRHMTTASKAASRNGSRSAMASRTTGPPARARATSIWLRVGSTPTTVAPERGGPAGELAFAAPDVEHTALRRRGGARRAGGSAPRTRGQRRR